MGKKVDRPDSWPPAPPADHPAPTPARDPVADVYGFIIDGHSNANILEYLESYGLAAADAKKIFEKALNKLLKAAKLPAVVRRGWCLEAYRHLYQKLVSTGDYAGALKAIQEIAKLAEVKDKAPPADPVAEAMLTDEVVDYIDKVMGIEWNE